MRRFVVVFLTATVLGEVPSYGCEFYTLSGNVAFELIIPGNGSVVKGTLHRVDPVQFASWDLSTFGQDADAQPGTHACADLGFNPFVSCPFFSNPPDCDADAVVFGLRLDGDSGPISQVGPAFSPFVQSASGGGAYIISSDAAERVPVSSSNGQFQFHTSNDPAVFIQAGESSVWLLARYQPDAVGTALGAGATMTVELRDNSVIPGIQFVKTGVLGLIPVSGAVTTTMTTATTTSTTLPDGISVCGDPVDPAAFIGASAGLVTASDALFTLQTAVGLIACSPCVCDVNNSGGVTASDALLILKRAVGQPIVLDCPVCS